LTAGIPGLRVGVPRRFFLERADPEIRKTTREVLEFLARAGTVVREVELSDMTHSRSVSLTVQMPEALSFHGKYLEQRFELYGADFRAGLALGQCLLAEHYVRARSFISVYRQDTNAVLENVDALLTPATPITAPRLGTRHVEIEGVKESAGNDLTRFTTFFNMTGHPAITLPTALHSDGLPMGVQIVGRYFDESTVLRVADAIERSGAFGVPLPPIG